MFLSPRAHHALRMLRMSSTMLAELQLLCLGQANMSLRRQHALDGRGLLAVLAFMLSLKAMAHANFLTGQKFLYLIHIKKKRFYYFGRVAIMGGLSVEPSPSAF